MAFHSYSIANCHNSESVSEIWVYKASRWFALMIQLGKLVGGGVADTNYLYPACWGWIKNCWVLKHIITKNVQNWWGVRQKYMLLYYKLVKIIVMRCQNNWNKVNSKYTTINTSTLILNGYIVFPALIVAIISD